MKLDYDLVRDILLTIEELESKEFLNNDTALTFSRLKKYQEVQIGYTVKKLAEAGFIDKNCVRGRTGEELYSLTELTWQGHQFLDTVRDENIWEQTKSHLKELAQSVPLAIIAEVAKHFLLGKVL